jgi:hypothetical protein
MTAISTTAVIKNERWVATSPGREQIKGGGGQRRGRRPFLDWKCQADGREKAKMAYLQGYLIFIA